MLWRITLSTPHCEVGPAKPEETALQESAGRSAGRMPLVGPFPETGTMTDRRLPLIAFAAPVFLRKMLVQWKYGEIVPGGCGAVPNRHPNGADILFFPDFEKSKAEVEELRAELSMLILEHDELIHVECRNIETQYMLEIGSLEYKMYELECDVMRLKRKAELLRANADRPEKTALPDIEKRLDTEFAEYEEKLSERLAQINEALEHSRGRLPTEEEAGELKELYRKIVLALHPDLNPGLGEEKVKLFRHAAEAYKNGNLRHLRVIGNMVAEPALSREKPDAFRHLKEEKERLAELVGGMKERIARIKSEFPYSMKAFLQNPERVEARKAERNAMIEQLKDLRARYAEKIRQLQG